MMRLRDASLLALTKLRTRRIRTLITIVISGLLFAILVAALVVEQGMSNSIASFNQEGLNSRYVVHSSTDSILGGGDAGILHNLDVQKRAQQIYDQTVASKTAAAKKLGITFDPKTEPLPLRELGGGELGRPVNTILNLGRSPAVSQAINEYLVVHPMPGLPELKSAAAPYHPTGFYSATTANPDGTIVTMVGGHENFSPTYGSSVGSHQDMLQSGQLTELDSHLTAPFILPAAAATDPTAIPLVVPYSQAEQLLNLPVLPKSASAEQHINRIKQLYVEITKVTLTACYRNAVSTGQISQAIVQASDAEQHVGDKTYQKPDLIYGLPAADSCAPAPIISDTRSTAAKTQADKQQQFDAEFSTKPLTPQQQKLTFRIAGLYPDVAGDNNTSIGGLLQTIVGSSLGGTIAIPSDLLDQMPNAASVKALLFPSSADYFGFPLQSYFIEFGTSSNAATFINEKGCTTRSDGTCATPTRQFQLNTYGSNSVALGDLQQKFTHYFTLTALGVVAVATVIMSTTIGRMITDGRRETAVFRAIGAKRGDIVAIYGVYTVCLSLSVAIFALVVGLAMATGIDNHFWREATVQAQLLFGASNSQREFHFFALNVLNIGVVLLIAIASGIISMIWPLIRNVRRNPIKDMREE
jgi:hypothetical protein